MAVVKAMCGFCGELMTKGQMVPGSMGGAKCKDWFGCAQRREALLRANVPILQAQAQNNRVGMSMTTGGATLPYMRVVS